MRFILLCILLFSFLSIKTESKPTNQNQNNFNCTKVDSLNQLAANRLKISYIEALQQASVANKLALNFRCIEGEIESLILKSYVWANTNKCRDALQLLDSLEKSHLNLAGSAIAGKLISAKAQCYYYLGDYDTSKFYFENAIEIFSISNMPELLAVQYNKLAKTFLQTGNTQKAGLNNEKARDIQIKINSKEGLAWSDDIQGEILQAQRLYEEALRTHQHSFKSFHNLNHLAGQASALLHAGNSHYMLVNDDSAYIYYNRALTAYKSLGDSNGMAISFSNLSRVALESGQVDEALQYADRSLSIIQGGEYKRIEASTLQQIGDIYLEMKQYDKAIIYIQKALIIAREIDLKVKVMDCYKSLSEIYAAINQHDQSYSYLLSAYRLKDSIQPIAFSRQLAEMEEKYESKQKEVQIQLLEQSSKIKSLEIRKRNFIIILTVLIFITISVTVLYFIQKQKMKTKLEKEQAIKLTEESERLRFAKDIHDELGSGLSKISFLSEIIVQDSKPKNDTIQTAASISETAKGLIDNMRDLIWALNPENSTFSTLLSDIREYASDYLEDYPAELVLNFPDKTDNRIISRECHREILLTIKEALNNIVKHSNSNKINIKAELNNSEFCVEVSDNGSGIYADAMSAGHGMKNMESRIFATGGKFEYESVPEAGTKILIKVPVAKMIIA